MIALTPSQSRLFVIAGMSIAAIAAVIVLGSAVFFQSRSAETAYGDNHHRVRVGNAEFWVGYVADEASRARGLSGRDSLGSHEGMLFFFPSAATYGFWMKDMRFDIDIVWIRGLRVIGVSERALAPRSPEDFLETYYPPDAVDMVLEIGAGTARELGIDAGDAVSLFE